MSSTLTQPLPPNPDAGPAAPFGATEMRLTGRQWLAALGILLLIAVATPEVWPYFERFNTPANYRIPYALSKDYWLFERRLRRACENDKTVIVLGDSVVWGEYVRPDGTLSCFLNQAACDARAFANCGVNGMFPLALEGLIDSYGRPLHGRKVILQCNPLWLSSPKADLSTTDEEDFNHARLVPQFGLKIPCYRASANQRISASIERRVEFLQWAAHIETAYFDDQSLTAWTLAQAGDPPASPNAWKNPLAQITLTITGELADDPRRGPQSKRHRPWNADGRGPVQFDWVGLDKSLQWQATQRLIHLLQSRGDDVLVVIGPFNEHMIDPEQLPQYQAIVDGMNAWLAANHVPHVIPAPLPSDLYADASHPLTDGYAQLARRLFDDAGFRAWLAAR